MGNDPRHLPDGDRSDGAGPFPLGRRQLLAGGVAALGGASRAVAAPPAAPIQIRRGINLNPWFQLTREFPAPSTTYDWPPFQLDRTVPTATDLARLKAAGFDFARLPVDPGPFLSFTGTPLDVLLNSVGAAVDSLLAAGLSVVLNIQPNDATHFWNSSNMVTSLDAPYYPNYKAFAVTLGTMLAARDTTRVALEPMNEPLGACDAGLSGPLQADLLAAIRAAAPSLTLVATGPCGSLIQGLPYLDPTTLAGLAPILFTIHFYEPYLFTHQGATWMSDPVYHWLTGVPWPASGGTLSLTLARTVPRERADTTMSKADKLPVWTRLKSEMSVYYNANPARWFIDQYLDMVTNWAAQYSIPANQILIGEMGALQTNAEFVGSAAADRARYISDVRQSAEAHDLSWAMWNAFGGFGMIDDQTRVFDPAIVSALGLTYPS